MASYYCICGAYARVSADNTAVVKWFKHQHQGEGHTSCSAASAARARRREDAKAAKEDNNT